MQTASIPAFQATVPHPHRLLARVRAETPAGLILRRILAYHPKPIDREVLMRGAGILVRQRGPISAYASFHWHVERANDELREFGWQIEQVASTETYSLVPALNLVPLGNEVGASLSNPTGDR